MPKKNKKSKFFTVPISKIQWSESYVSLLLGLLIVLVAGLLVLLFSQVRWIRHEEFRTTGTSAPPSLLPKLEKNNPSEEVISGNTYMVKDGDDLWNIAVRAYGDGYKWVEIANVNNLYSPDYILVGDTIKIPR